MQTSSRVPAHNQQWWCSHRQRAMEERWSILPVPFTIKRAERLCLISSGGETKLYRAGVLRGEVRGWWWWWRWGRRHRSSCCCLFMQLSNIRAVGSLSGAWRGPRLSLLDLWRLGLFEQFLPVLPVSCAPPSVSPGMWVESAHTPAFVKAELGGGSRCVFPPSELRENVSFFYLLTV